MENYVAFFSAQWIFFSKDNVTSTHGGATPGLGEVNYLVHNEGAMRKNNIAHTNAINARGR